MQAILFVVIPLLVYIIMFSVECFVAIRRVGKPLNDGGEYLHITWEVTHTFLVLSLNYFMWLYSSAVVDVGTVVFLPLMMFGALFVVRAIIYIYLFYIKQKDVSSLIIDLLFAVVHILMLGAVLYTAIAAIRILSLQAYGPNDALLPLLYPGLALMIPLISVPLYKLYRR